MNFEIYMLPKTLNDSFLEKILHLSTIIAVISVLKASRLCVVSDKFIPPCIKQ